MREKAQQNLICLKKSTEITQIQILFEGLRYVCGANLSQAGLKLRLLIWPNFLVTFTFYIQAVVILVNNLWNSSVYVLRHFQHTFSTIAAIVVSFWFRNVHQQ